jgi:hypothetical protein
MRCFIAYLELTQDIVGYRAPGSDAVMGVLTDNVSPALTASLEVVAGAYAGIGTTRNECGYGCSGI